MAAPEPSPDTSTTVLQIRPARPADADFVRALTPRFASAGVSTWRDPVRMALFFEHGIGEVAAAIAADRLNADEAILIATATGQSLGFIHLRPDVSSLTLESQGYVNALAILPEAEGCGIGRALLTAGEDWARERGFRLLTLETFGGNRHARDFYARCGYAEESVKLVKRL